MPKPFVHTRDVACPTCGEPPGSPCRLRSGKPLQDLHCTSRIAKAGGVEPMVQVPPPYTPGEWPPAPSPQTTAPTANRSGPPQSPQHAAAVSLSGGGVKPATEPTVESTPEEAAPVAGVVPEPEKHPAPSRPRRRERKPAQKSEFMPTLF